MTDTTHKKIQSGAIRKSIELGLVLQRDIPEIAEDARNGKTRSWIVDNYDIVSRYRGFTEGHLTRCVAKQGVYYAENGHGGGFGIPPYKGFFDEEEKKRISGKYLVEFHRHAGNRSLELKVGVHANSIFWGLDEPKDTYGLSQSPEYQFQEGSNMGKPNIELIRKEINKRYHGGKDVRTHNSIKYALFIFRKKMKKKEKDLLKSLSQ